MAGSNRLVVILSYREREREREREIVNSNLRACQVVAGRAITAIITYRVHRKHYQRTKQLNLITISYIDQLSSKPPISLITAAL